MFFSSKARADMLQALDLLSTSPSLHSWKFRNWSGAAQPTWRVLSLGHCLYHSSTFEHCLGRKPNMNAAKRVKRNKVAFNAQKICYTCHLIFF